MEELPHYARGGKSGSIEAYFSQALRSVAPALYGLIRNLNLLLCLAFGFLVVFVQSVLLCFLAIHLRFPVL